MLTKVFWIVVALDGIAAFVLWKSFTNTMGAGVLILAYLLLLAAVAITGCVFLCVRSEGWRIAVFVILLLWSAPLVWSGVSTAVTKIQSQRQFDGSAYFQGPAQGLAQAMVDHDAVLLKQLIPAAGDLNQPHGNGVTLWQFGVMQTQDTEESIDVLRALIAAGADPKRDTSSDALTYAMVKGPQLTRFLLEAGANPNVLDRDHRPVWWGTMHQAEDDTTTELLKMMLDHGADLTLRRPDGRGPVGQAVADGYWYDACLLVERGADWKQEKLSGGSFPQLLEWEIIRRDEYPLRVPDTMRRVLAGLKGEPLVIPAPREPPAGELRIPDILSHASFDQLEQTRAAVSRLAQQPDWVRRVVAFFEGGDSQQPNHVALVLSLKPEALPEDVQERCWTVLREQVAWYDHVTASVPNERKGWLLKETAIIAAGLASVPGPVRERHRADFTGLRDRIEKCRKTNDPDASSLADLNKADWVGVQATGTH